MKIQELDDKLKTIEVMLDVMNKVKTVYFPAREDKDTVVQIAHDILKRELNDINSDSKK